MPIPELAANFLSFLDASPSPWHASTEIACRLKDSGFRELREADPSWRVAPGEGLFVRRAGAIVAWIMPRETPRTLVLGLAHTDSPCLRLKPHPEQNVSGCRRLSTEVYGGLLNHSWLDRELRVAGRVALHDGAELREELVELDNFRPIVPSLAIHLDRGVNDRGLVLDRERQLAPLAGLDSEGSPSIEERIARILGCAKESVLGWDLCLVDAAPASVAGAGDLIVSGRIDNLSSCHALLRALLELEPAVARLPMVAFLDGEEVGSSVPEGADSRFLSRLIERLLAASGLGGEQGHVLLSHGFAFSCDMAHGVHPNFADRHDPRHAPLLGKGAVVKWNAGLRYATTATGMARLRLAAGRAGVPLQVFSMRADLACGSTVGPLVASGLGLEVVDCGAPMLSMHASRETMALSDHLESMRLYHAVLSEG